MAVDPRKRQKKLEKQKAKKKAEQKGIARRQSAGMPVRLEASGRAPILHCCHTKALWEGGIGNVLVSRALSTGNVAFAIFLVDVFCLGVKNVYIDIIPRVTYDDRIYERMFEQEGLRHIKPECARKLVEGAVEYAAALELLPHPEYRIGKLIFGDISAEACTQQFTYGKDGKPLFIAGPNDDSARCQDILHTLERICRPDGFHFLMPINPDEEFVVPEEAEPA
jgi:hypothetical protein